MVRRLTLPLSGALLLSPAWGGPAPDPAAEYAARLEKLGEKDVKGWLRLADFCEERLLFGQREEALRKAVAAEPDNAEAHKRLDEARFGKEWLPADEADSREIEEQQGKGLSFYGA